VVKQRQQTIPAGRRIVSSPRAGDSAGTGRGGRPAVGRLDSGYGPSGAPFRQRVPSQWYH